MQVDSSNGSLQIRFFFGTGSSNALDFNDKYVFSKMKSGTNDEEYRKQQHVPSGLIGYSFKAGDKSN